MPARGRGVDLSRSVPGHISYEEAIRNADSANELRLNMKLKSKRGLPPTAGGSSLSLHEEASPAEIEALRQAEQAKQAQRKRELEDQQLTSLRQAKMAQTAAPA